MRLYRDDDGSRKQPNKCNDLCPTAPMTASRVSALISCVAPPIHPNEPRTLKTVRIKVEKGGFKLLRATFSDSPVCLPV